MGVGGDDGLGALALEAAPGPVDLEGRAGAAALERREAGLADQRGRTGQLEVGPLVERELAERLAVEVGEQAHVVVEAGDADPAVRALEGGDDRGESEDRVSTVPP